jgi:hypothetical protein
MTEQEGWQSAQCINNHVICNNHQLQAHHVEDKVTRPMPKQGKMQRQKRRDGFTSSADSFHSRNLTLVIVGCHN